MYKNKYLKYKSKYLMLKSKLENKQMIKQTGGDLIFYKTYNNMYNSSNIFINNDNIFLLNDESNTILIINKNNEDLVGGPIELKDEYVNYSRSIVVNGNKIFITSNIYIKVYQKIKDSDYEYKNIKDITIDNVSFFPSYIAITNIPMLNNHTNDKCYESLLKYIKLTTYNKIFVTDSVLKCVYIFKLDDYKYVGNFGSEGDGDGQFQNPTGIAVSYDKILVVDSKKNNVQVFDLHNYNFLDKFGKKGVSNGKFNNPTSIVVNNNYIFIADTGNNRIQIFDFDFDFITTLNPPNNANQKFINPISIAIDDDKIYVADNKNNRIQVFTFDYDDDTNTQIENIKKNITANYYQLIGHNGMYEYRGDTIDIEIKFKLEEIDGKQVINYNFQDNIIFNKLFNNRDDLLNDKPIFTLKNIDSIKKEAGMDSGALANTVFENLSLYLSSNKFGLFQTGKDTKLTNLLYNDRVDLNKVNFLGILFGLSIKFKLLMHVDLHPFLLYQMIHDDFYNLTPDQIEDIITEFDSKLFNYIPFMCFKRKKWPTSENNYCGLKDNPEPDDKERKNLWNEYINLDINNRKFDTYEKIKDDFREINLSVEAFVEGFRDTVNINTIGLKNKPIKVLDRLFVGERVVTLDKIFEQMKFINFIPEHEKIMKEIIKQNYIDSNSNPNYLKKLLELTTGTSRLPSGGYPDGIIFEISYDIKIPYKANSCLKTILINYSEFDKSYDQNQDNKIIKESELYKYFSLELIIYYINQGYTIA